MRELCALLLAIWVVLFGAVLLVIYDRGWDVKCVPIVMPRGGDAICQGIPIPGDDLCEPVADLWLCGLWAPYTADYPE